MPKVIGIVPARSGSKGVPDKNIKEINGYPLLAYSIMAAQQASLIDDIYVSTDSNLYADIAKAYGAKAPFLRPADISGDKAHDKEFIVHFLDWYSSHYPDLPEYIVHLRPTTPLRNPRVIDEAIRLMLSTPNATALRSVHEMSESAYKTVEIQEGVLKSVFTLNANLDQINAPRQGFPKTYLPNGYVDVLKVHYILNNQGFHGDCVIPFITESVVEIDSPEDFDRLNFEMRSYPHKAKD